MNLFFVNLEGVRVLGVNDEAETPEVHVELVREIVGCPTCGVVAGVKDRHRVTLVDLTMAGRMVVLVWNKRRFRCLELDCSQGTWTEVEPRIAAPRLKMTDRAGRWATFEVGKNGRTVREVSEHLGCD
ncbi:MAG TPA: transposase family protein [Acidimicrobiales bacterium]|nr:transposase family protein [Acidimicrobiales bacterium]